MKAIVRNHLPTTGIIARRPTAQAVAQNVTFQVASRENFLGDVTINDHF